MPLNIPTVMFVNLMFTISRTSHMFTAVLGNYLHQLLFNVCQAGFRSGATGQDKRDVAPQVRSEEIGTVAAAHMLTGMLFQQLFDGSEERGQRDSSREL